MAKINVIMGIYNCEKTLKEAVDCLLKQTYSDWELIMCDDGSTDETFRIAQELQSTYPAKIRLLKNDKNRGLNYTLNHCLSVADGEFIARMDGDDLCSPDRFEIEMNVMNSEPDISIVSCAIEHFDESGIWGYVTHPEYPTNKDFLYGTPFCHAPCLVRREAYVAVGGYTENEKILRVEDYHLWIKMYKAGFKGKNIDLPLYQMRDDRNAYGRRKFKYRINEAYVRAFAIKELKLPFYGYLHVIRPVLVGLLPSKLYDILHKKNIKKKEMQ